MELILYRHWHKIETNVYAIGKYDQIKDAKPILQSMMVSRVIPVHWDLNKCLVQEVCS